MEGVALFLSWNVTNVSFFFLRTRPGLGLQLLGYHGLFDTELWSFGFILASEGEYFFLKKKVTL